MLYRLRLLLFVGVSAIAANLNVEAVQFLYTSNLLSGINKILTGLLFVSGLLICGYFTIDLLKKIRESYTE